MDPIAYSVTDAAALLGIGRTTAYDLIATGELRACKVGSRTLVSRRALEDFVAAREAAAVAS